MVALVVRLRQRARGAGNGTASLGPAGLGWVRRGVAMPGKDGGPDGRISGSTPLADTRGVARRSAVGLGAARQGLHQASRGGTPHG